jgi:hypothetical protein
MASELLIPQTVVELGAEKGAAPMGLLDFIASLVGSLAWPVAAIIIALLFRRQLTGLLNKIRRLTWGDTAVDFADKLDKLENVSREAATEQPDAPVQHTLPDDRFQRLLEISPSAAILDAWGPVEQSLRHISKGRNYDPATLKSPFKTMKQLEADKLVSPTIYKMLRDLQNLRNAAAHQREVSPTDALRFRELAEQVLRALAL